MDEKLKSITETAKELNVTAPQLRNWDKQGLITSIKESSGRYFSESEFKKIEKIRDMFDDARKAGIKKTYDDIRRELMAENILVEQKQEDELTQHEKVLSVAFERVLERQGLDQAFEMIGQEFNKLVAANNSLQAQVQDMKQTIEQMSLRLEAPKEEETDLRKELDKTNETLREIASALEQKEQQEDQEANEYKEASEKAKLDLEKYKEDQQNIMKQLEEIKRREEAKEKQLKEEQEEYKRVAEELKELKEEKEQQKKGFFSKLFGK